MIWSDPWIDLATTRGSHDSPYCTLLPPQRHSLPEGFVFECVKGISLSFPTWTPLIGTRFGDYEIQRRLHGSWIPCLWKDKQLIATCVLRPQHLEDVNLWIIESLVVDPSHRGQGYGRILMREFMTWLWWHFGAFVLGFTWELHMSGLLNILFSDKRKAISTIQAGWIWKGETCEEEHTTDSVLVTDSGLGDNTGYVVSWSDDRVCWPCVAKKERWHRLWCRSTTKPDGEWQWSGEIVAIGFLNANQPERLSNVWGHREITVRP